MIRLIASKTAKDEKRFIVQINGSVYEETLDTKNHVWRRTVPVSEQTLREMIHYRGYQKHEPPNEIENEGEMYKIIRYYNPNTPEEWRNAIRDYHEKMTRPILSQ